MTAAAPSLPNDRQIAELAHRLHLGPDSHLWVGTVLVHHVEATVREYGGERLNVLELGLLRAVKVLGSASVQRLSEMLGLPTSAAERLCQHLSEHGLLAFMANHHWRLTPRGGQVLEDAETAAHRCRRRDFFFLRHPDGQPRFLHLAASGVGVNDLPHDWHFDLAWLEKCIQESEAWKHRHGFPAEVLGVVRNTDTSDESLPPWCRIALDRAEQFCLIVVVHKEDLEAFLADPQSWNLATASPILRLKGRDALHETFGDMLALPDADSWHAAWRSWCQARSIPLPEAPGIQFQHRGTTLVVVGHPLRPERLRALASDAGREEHWLLAGSGPLRCAARLEFGLPRPSRPGKQPPGP
ncbi:MAG: helix-turn-helix domain-containing protein [Gemmatales bacterium]|nr:helix-turn-helix domain-containing protein [Gemmatales bacterium]MDW8386421.1 helix-turn-helix domain-containing protein [Gemmatales bacterium]